MQRNGCSCGITQHDSSNCDIVRGTMAVATTPSGVAPECDSCDCNHNDKDLKPSLTALETDANFTERTSSRSCRALPRDV